MMFIGAVVFSVSIAAETTASGCTVCSGGNDECHRIIQGNTVHIFHGVPSPCESESDQ